MSERECPDCGSSNLEKPDDAALWAVLCLDCGWVLAG